MAYDKVNWGSSTPINVSNLSKMDSQIFDNDSRISQIVRDVTAEAFAPTSTSTGGSDSNEVKVYLIGEKLAVCQIKIRNVVNPTLGFFKNYAPPDGLSSAVGTPSSSSDAVKYDIFVSGANLYAIKSAGSDLTIDLYTTLTWVVE